MYNPRRMRYHAGMNNRGGGRAVMVASSVLFSAMSILIVAAQGVDSSIIACARFVTGAAAIAGLALTGVIRLKMANFRWLIVRGGFGATSVYLLYRGIVHLGLAKGTILNYTYPMFAALLAPSLLKERLSPDVLAAGIVSFGGVWLIVGSTAAGGLTGFGGIGPEEILALTGGVLAGVAVVAIKKLRETDSPYVIYLSQCIFGLLVVVFPAAGSSFLFPVRAWLLLLGIGILATAGQLLMTWAYKHVTATEGSLLAFLTPVLNLLFGLAIFGETVRLPALLGSAVVLLACAYVALRERLLRLA